MRWLAVGVTALMLAGCAGCTPAPSDSGGAGGQNVTPHVDHHQVAASDADVAGSSAGYALYQSVSENRRFVDSAVQELVRRCMIQAGFQYWPVQQLPAEYRDPARPLSVADASTRGYRALVPPTNAPGSTEREAYLASLTPDQLQQYGRALGGDPDATKTVDTPAGKLTFTTGGCTSSALGQLVPDPARYQTLAFQVSNLTSLPEFQPTSDPGLQAATRTWSECMSTAGYRYGSPAEAIEAASAIEASSAGGSSAPLPDQPPPAARAIAVADATCRAKTNWDTANRIAVHNALAVVVDTHQTDILSFNDMAMQAAQKAKQVLGR